MDTENFTLKNGVTYLLRKALWGINPEENSYVRLPKDTEVTIVDSGDIKYIKIKAYPKKHSSTSIEMTAKKHSVVKSILG